MSEITAESKPFNIGKAYVIVMSYLMAIGFVLCIFSFVMRAVVNGNRELETAANSFAAIAFGGTLSVCLLGMVLGGLAAFYGFIRSMLAEAGQ